MSLPAEETTVTQEPPTGEIVHWMEPHGPRFAAAPAGLGAFVMGVAAALAVWAAYRWWGGVRQRADGTGAYY